MYFLFFALLGWLQGIPTYEPVVTGVNANSPAQTAGLLKGDLVTQINGNDISETLDQMRERHEHVESCQDSLPKALRSFFDGDSYEDVVTGVNANSPAQTAGLLKGDLVTQINGNNISTWDELAAAVQKKPGETLEFKVQRDDGEKTLYITPEVQEQKGQKVGIIGITYRSPMEKQILCSLIL